MKLPTFHMLICPVWLVAVVLDRVCIDYLRYKTQSIVNMSHQRYDPGQFIAFLLFVCSSLKHEFQFKILSHFIKKETVRDLTLTPNPKLIYQSNCSYLVNQPNNLANAKGVHFDLPSPPFRKYTHGQYHHTHHQKHWEETLKAQWKMGFSVTATWPVFW